MQFIITRTSDYEDEKPCDGAYRGLIDNWETRTCTEEYFNATHSHREGLWRSKGKNHAVVNDGKYITRQMEDAEVWLIDMNTMDDVMSLVKNVGEIIIKPNFWSKEKYEIEIYDNYRE